MDPEVPGIFSVAFHLGYFPELVWSQLWGHPDSRKRHVLIEIPIVFVGALVLVGSGLPGAVEQHSPQGWALTLFGAGGALAILLYCLRSSRGLSLSYAEFEPWVFLLLCALGVLGGMVLGLSWHWPWTGAFLGASAGYWLGLGAGLQAQRLGPLRVFVALAAGLGLFGLAVTAAVWVFYIKQ